MPRCGSKSVAEKICFVSNSRSKSLATALYDSIVEEDLNEIEFLLKHKQADPNYLLPEFGITPVHCSVGCGSEDHAFKVVSFIVSYGGNPNVRCSEGTTPVLISALWGRLHILKLLLVHGGNPLLCDDDGLNALDYAEQNYHKHVLFYLRSWKKYSNALLGSPSTCRSDAVTQTSIMSYEGRVIKSSSETPSDDFVSCDEPSSDDNSLSKRRLLGCQDVSVIMFPDSPDKSVNEYNSFNNLDVSTLSREDNDCSVLEKAFICDNASDLFSDIDSDIDVLNSVSIYNPDENEDCSKLNFDSSNLKPSFTNIEVYKHVVNETMSSIGSSYTSCNQQDIGFVGQLPGEKKKPTEEMYTDDEAGIVLIQRNFPPDLSDSDHSLCTKKSNNSHCSAESYDTDNLANKLKECKLFSGPVTKTTKKVYARQLNRFIKSENIDNKDNKYAISSVLTRTFSDNYLKLMEQWTPLETQMSEEFLKNSTKYKFRGGVAKCFFNYLLMDPSVTNNLPQRVHSMDCLDVWKTFIKAIFYVGKGKQSRPYAHLYEALKPNKRKPPSNKVLKILEIWNNKQGVVCLMIFHNIISAEALTREAAMIDVLADGNLTNAQGGEYHGVATSWNMKQKCQLGAVLLHRALAIYLAEGERQISPPDLEVRPNFRY